MKGKDQHGQMETDNERKMIGNILLTDKSIVKSDVWITEKKLCEAQNN